MAASLPKVPVSLPRETSVNWCDRYDINLEIKQ